MTEIFQIAGMAFSFFLALVIIRKRNYEFYGIVFFIGGLILVEKYLWETELIKECPYLVEVFAPLSFSIPICLYLGSPDSLKSNFKWVLFAIALLPFLNFLPLYTAGTEYKTCYILHEMIGSLPGDCEWAAKSPPTYINESILDILLILEFLGLVYLLKLKRGREFQNRGSKKSLFPNNWEKVVFGLVCFAGICTILGILFAPDAISLNSYFIPIIGFLTGVFIIDQSTLFKTTAKGNAYRHLSKKEISAIYDKIENTLQEERYYSNNELSLVYVAKEMNLSANKLSYVLSSSQTSFKELVNRIRIQKATDFMKTKAIDTYSIEGVAKMFGYKSKSTFYQNFKKQYAKTPREFIKEYQNGSKT